MISQKTLSSCKSLVGSIFIYGGDSMDLYDFARKYGKDGVIDIACGTGAVLLYLAEHGILADEYKGYICLN